MQLCEGYTHEPSYKVRNIVHNQQGADRAFKDCAARMQCLVAWITSPYAALLTCGVPNGPQAQKDP